VAGNLYKSKGFYQGKKIYCYGYPAQFANRVKNSYCFKAHAACLNALPKTKSTLIIQSAFC
jgi:hypothetical protein